MHVGFTGTKEGMTPRQKKLLAEVLAELIQSGYEFFHHGDCVGADEEAHEIAADSCLKVIIHPPVNDYLRAWCSGAFEVRPPLPYMQRNQAIVDETNPLLACPKEVQEQLRSGTWSTVRRAKKADREIIILTP